jgi:hypothetical protein
LAGSEDVKTVSGKEYKNITGRGFSAAPVKKTHRPAAVTCGVPSRDGSPNNLTCARRGNRRIQAGYFFSKLYTHGSLVAKCDNVTCTIGYGVFIVFRRDTLAA